MQLSEHQCYWTNKGYPEDRLFWIFLLSSFLIYLIIVVVAKNSQLDSSASVSSQAPNQAVNISLSLLQSQHTTQPAKSKPITKKVPQKAPIQKQKKSRRTNFSKPVESRPAKPLVKSPAISQPVTAPQLSPQMQRGKGNQQGPIKEKYLSALLTHIETYKYYPQAARRRGLSGAIDISFRLFGDGHIKGLAVSGGPVLLRRAAEQSVKQALPMPLPPSEVETPIQISLVMQYQLH